MFWIFHLYVTLCESIYILDLWESFVGAGHIVPTFSVTDFVAIAASLESISKQLLRQRRRGDLGMMGLGCGRPVCVHNVVTVPFHNVRRTFLPEFSPFCFTLFE